jgi:Tfp pilus assembly protein PilF
MPRPPTSARPKAAAKPPSLWEQALTLHRAGKKAEAADAYAKIIENGGKESGSAWNNLAVLRREQGKLPAALACARRAEEISPDDPNVLNNLGNILKDLARHDDAIATFQRALNIAPDRAGLHHNHGIALREAGRHADSLAAFDASLKLKPDDAKVQWDRALALLMLERFADGWAAYESRWHIGEIKDNYPPEKRWRGESFAGKTLLVHPEQGFGDSILAARCLPLAKARGGRVVLGAKPPLTRLLAGIAGVDQLVTPGDRVDYDLQISVMSLLGIFGITHDTVPPPPRLALPPEATAKFRPLIARAGKRLKVGFVWSGSTTFKGNSRRATTVDRFLALADVPNVALFSLQKGPLEKELAQAAAAPAVIDIGGKVEDFAETAAVIEMLDLVIQTDSATAHLAGTLGKPVWNLLPYVPYWLYRHSGDTTPWYPSMRLFRQPAVGDWDSVFDRVRAELATLAAQKNN